MQNEFEHFSKVCTTVFKMTFCDENVRMRFQIGISKNAETFVENERANKSLEHRVKRFSEYSKFNFS